MSCSHSYKYDTGESKKRGNPDSALVSKYGRIEYLANGDPGLRGWHSSNSLPPPHGEFRRWQVLADGRSTPNMHFERCESILNRRDIMLLERNNRKKIWRYMPGYSPKGDRIRYFFDKRWTLYGYGRGFTFCRRVHQMFTKCRQKCHKSSTIETFFGTSLRCLSAHH